LFLRAGLPDHSRPLDVSLDVAHSLPRLLNRLGDVDDLSAALLGRRHHSLGDLTGHVSHLDLGGLDHLVNELGHLLGSVLVRLVRVAVGVLVLL